jgi:hypothetical protein
MNHFIFGGLLAIGISLCVSGFRAKGLPLTKDKRITGTAAKIVGILALLLSIAAAAFWIGIMKLADGFRDSRF